ncbi:MAG: outer membrane lipoprotein-sorting protein [Pseudomonadota bacterium]
MLRMTSYALAFTALLGATSALAQTAQERGFAIAEKAADHDTGYGTSRVMLTMTLTTPAGQSTTRELRIDTFERPDRDEGDMSVTVFFSPRDIEGTALLSHAEILEPDDQWLWLPALNRVRRISSANKSGPFVGSEFAFEDLTAGELGKFDYTYLETTTVGGMEMDVLECLPNYDRSGYSKIHCFHDTDIGQIRQLEFFDRGGQLLKTLTFEEYRQYDGRIWRAHRQIMVNHLTGRQTVLEFGDFEFGIDLDERDFEPEALELL